MKKIGILTATTTNNIGTDLQALAMQQIFTSIANNSNEEIQIELIKYRNTKLESMNKLIPRITLKNILYLPWRLFNDYVHKQFRKRWFKHSNIEYKANDLDVSGYDIIVVGSDQVWNLSLTGDDMNFFLPCQSSMIHKYSYAASIGNTDVCEWNKKYNLSLYLSEFKRISVRESSAINTMKMIGINAQQDLDPLLMVEANEWRRYMYNHHKINNKYVLIYIAESNDQALSYAVEYAQKNNLEVIMLSNGLRINKNIKIKRFVSVEKWLMYMDSASLLITSSYHGLSMAIDLHINFRAVELKNNQSNSRLSSLLSDFCLEEFSLGQHYEAIPDWEFVDRLLLQRRKKSKEYVEEIINERISTEVSNSF